MSKRKYGRGTAAMAGLLAGLAGFLLMAVWTSATKWQHRPSIDLPLEVKKAV